MVSFLKYGNNLYSIVNINKSKQILYYKYNSISTPKNIKKNHKYYLRNDFCICHHHIYSDKKMTYF